MPNLKSEPTEVQKPYKSKEEGREILWGIRGDLIELQEKLYADSRHSLLLILQGMDTSGKDGLIRHVFSGINPQGVRVTSFKKPSEEELAHDYLWRCQKELPRKGTIGVFNRSYYEEVIVVRVVPELLKLQKLPEITSEIWSERYKQINSFEEHLTANGTKIVKCFLHLSKAEQKMRLIKRLEDNEKNWKFELGDLSARKQWEEYEAAYEECLSETGTAENPWHIIPADDKHTARIMVAEILRDALKSLPLEYPAMSKELHAKIDQIKSELDSE